MLLGGVHGNELTGIAVVKRLLADFLEGKRALTRGSLILALGNLRAIERGMRGSVPHADMNRVFTARKLADPSDYEEWRASELAPFMASSDILIDIHSTNKPSKPFAVAKALDGVRLALAGCFPVEEYLVSPPEIIGGTTDAWISENGGTGLGYESGQAGDVSKVPETLDALDRVLAHLDMTHAAIPFRQAVRPRISRLNEAVIMPEGGFAFAEGRGCGSFEPFAAGDVIGHSGGASVTASYDCLLMFPKIAEHRRPGAPVAFLAIAGYEKTRS